MTINDLIAEALAAEIHQSTPEGMSPRPISQFLTEVEKLLVDHDLI